MERKFLMILGGLLLSASLFTSCQKEIGNPDPKPDPHLEFRWDGQLIQDNVLQNNYFADYLVFNWNDNYSLRWVEPYRYLNLYLDSPSLNEKIYVMRGTYTGTYSYNLFSLDGNISTMYEDDSVIVNITKIENGYASGTLSGRMTELTRYEPFQYVPHFITEGKFENIPIVTGFE